LTGDLKLILVGLSHLTQKIDRSGSTAFIVLLAPSDVGSLSLTAGTDIPIVDGVEVAVRSVGGMVKLSDVAMVKPDTTTEGESGSG